MTKILFLIPPSEWKNLENKYEKENLNFVFDRPIYISQNATEKDLKCTWKRYLEAINLNNHIWKSKSFEAINRYSWVMYNSIDFQSMSQKSKLYFQDNFLILSWLYGLVKPMDNISNYKLPVETKWIYEFWWDTIFKEINNMKIDYVVNLLPNSYYKMLFWKTKNIEKQNLQNMNFSLININFLKEDWKKISHWVKKIKWEWIKDICENNIKDINNFWWKMQKKWNIIDINILKK